ncbi:MAG TPA: AraC family ligand binding domain-containing protein [Acetobacteraceae bacterium]
MTAGGRQIQLVHDGATGVEAIHARFAGHAYDLHRHEDWLVGITEAGVQDFCCRGRRWRSTPGRVILIELGEAHDGQAGTTEGFAYIWRLPGWTPPWRRCRAIARASPPLCATIRSCIMPSAPPAPCCAARTAVCTAMRRWTPFCACCLQGRPLFTAGPRRR